MKSGNQIKTHELQTWPQYFEMMQDGSKKFELRKDDRGFEVGDVLYLREYDPETNTYSGRTLSFIIQVIVRDAPQFGLMPGYAILGV